ncbi:pyridoxamine 5'-phosphate oxidase family protein [Halococcus thailandensis]|uniref:Pyridoxamine 5'-phosphate oxidase-like FMN-binding protein n=1 Tax=Halococcus thailandensis JCM 13552 TaxID=1227457 RepID=M0N2V5_9EURY|nr:pyridoxamine 5'-phosphate oxidase family protein [Halococcus thailandensis]EMA51449.1 pyridoxamine 5'-phosphate oxidase-like FMN-binding protein [Halococcus thailandensis JCM 13552]
MTVPEEVEELIADAPLSAHLATAADDRPHVAPVWYGYRDGVVSVLTTGKKLANVRENPRVAISIEKQGDDGPEWSVSLLGTATVVEDSDRTQAARKRVFGKYRETDDEEDGEGTLIEIDVGSATSSHY